MGSVSSSESESTDEERDPSLPEKLLAHQETDDEMECGAPSSGALPKSIHESSEEEPPRKMLKTSGAFSEEMSYSERLWHTIVSGDVAAFCVVLYERNFVDVQNDKGETALHLAAKHGRDEMAMLLMLSGAHTRLKNFLGHTPLHTALSLKNRNTANVIATVDRQSVNDLKDKKGETPLQLAVKAGYVEIARNLLAAGANTRLQNTRGHTPLHTALCHGQGEIANDIVHVDSKNDVQDKGGNTPLRVAVKKGYIKIARKLLVAGANTRLQGRGDRTPLHTALLHGQEDIANDMVDVDSKNDVQDKEGNTPLRFAVREGYAAIVKKLLVAGANIHTQNSKGHTPLHTALRHRREDIANDIADVDSKIDVQDENGETPLHIAVKIGYIDIVRKLLCHNVRPNVLSNSGKSPLEMGLNAKEKDIVQIVTSACALRGVAIDWKNLNAEQKDIHFCMKLYAECCCEIQLMKQSQFDCTYVSFYDVLSSDIHKLSVYLRNDDIRKVLLSKNVTARYPNYDKLITYKVELAEARNILNDHCFHCFALLFRKCPTLPVVSIDIILTFLTNLEKKNFVEAFRFKALTV